MTRFRAVRVRAHAKINLALGVGTRQSDGFHPLRTVFQSLDLHDTLELTLRPGPFALSCSDPAVPADDRNLVARAAGALWSALGREGVPRGVAVHLTKHIPMQAGLGGGSSDAASALSALARLWRFRGAPADLAAIASRLGSDVPYFLLGGTALGLSRGEELYPLEDLPARSVVLALPAFGVSTADAYRWFDEAPLRTAGAPAGAATSIAAWRGWPLELRNDLEAPVTRRHPEIGAARRALESAGADAALMTGSGSAVFGLFATERAARRGARAVAEAGFVALPTRTVDRRTCQRVHFSFASASPRHA
ncbi:MAG: 4-(cytidine 5'-diphospho)-2-C-methyl-D-erythritol kinase [Vicinamibacterales bacterium]